MEFIEIDSKDIEDIFFFPFNINNNSFYSTEKRTLPKIEIEVDNMLDGGDWDWYYGFEKMRVEEKGIMLSPEERYCYLAMKFFYEPDSISKAEKSEIFVSEKVLNEYVGFYYFKILEDKKFEVKDKIKIKFVQLFYKRMYEKRMILNKYLLQAGSSLEKLMKEDLHMVGKLFMKLVGFHQRRLNVLGQYPIYMDVDSYMHILTRHVEDFKFNEQYKHKDNFQWFEEDVLMVMKKVVESIDDEYQIFRIQNSISRYSRYGNQSVYFHGDYYTLHIEPSGRIDTFYKNRKATSNLQL